MFQIFVQYLLADGEVGRPYIIEKSIAEADLADEMAKVKGRFPGMIVSSVRA